MDVTQCGQPIHLSSSAMLVTTAWAEPGPQLRSSAWPGKEEQVNRPSGSVP